MEQVNDNLSEYELKVHTIYDHYKDTIDYLKKDITKRDKMTLNVFLSFIFYFLIEIKPLHSVNIANTWIKDKVGISLGINYNFLSTTILLFLLWSIIRYFQMCLNIESQYDYIHKLEKKINILVEKDFITREGHSYLAEYPLLKALIHRMYIFFLPVGIGLSFIIKIIFIPPYDLSLLSLVNIFIQLMIVLLVFLYLLFTHRSVALVQKLNNLVKSLFIKFYLYTEDINNEEKENGKKRKYVLALTILTISITKTYYLHGMQIMILNLALQMLLQLKLIVRIIVE